MFFCANEGPTPPTKIVGRVSSPNGLGTTYRDSLDLPPPDNMKKGMVDGLENMVVPMRVGSIPYIISGVRRPSPVPSAVKKGVPHVPLGTGMLSLYILLHRR